MMLFTLLVGVFTYSVFNSTLVIKFTFIYVSYNIALFRPISKQLVSMGKSFFDVQHVKDEEEANYC